MKRAGFKSTNPKRKSNALEDDIDYTNTVFEDATAKPVTKRSKKTTELKRPGVKSASANITSFPSKAKAKAVNTVSEDESKQPEKKKSRTPRRNKVENPPVSIDHTGETSQYKMEIRTPHGKTFRKLIDNITTLLKFVDLRFYPQGIYICAADVAKYMLITTSLYARNFSKYYCPQRYKITLDIVALNNALSSVHNFETLSFVFEEGSEPRNLVLLMKSKDREKKVVLFGMNSESKIFKVPKQTLEKPMVFDASKFQQDIRSMCFYSPIIIFATDFEQFHMFASGDQVNTVICTVLFVLILIKGSSHLRLFPEKEGDLEEPQCESADFEPKAEVEVKEDDEQQDNEVFLDNNSNGPVQMQREEPSREEEIIQDNLKKGEEFSSQNPGDADKYLVDEETNVQTPDEDPAPVQEAPSEKINDPLMPKFDSSYCSGMFILRYFHTICKNTNLDSHVEIMFKKGKFITVRYSVETLGHITFCILECHNQNQ